MKKRIIVPLIAAVGLCGCGDVVNRDTIQSDLIPIEETIFEIISESEAETTSAIYDNTDNASDQTSELFFDSTELFDFSTTTSFVTDTAAEYIYLIGGK